MPGVHLLVGATASWGPEAQIFQTMMIEEPFVDLTSSDMDDFEECGIYTGGDGVFSKPGKVDFLTIESDADFVELEDSAPKLVELLFSRWARFRWRAVREPFWALMHQIGVSRTTFGSALRSVRGGPGASVRFAS